MDLFKDAPFINVKDGYPEEALELPVIVVEFDEIQTEPFEIGSRTRAKYRQWNIDIYAENKSQRDEYAFRILHTLEDKIAVYDYDQGFPPTTIPKIGVVDPSSISVKIIPVLPELTEKLYYRAMVTFIAEYTDLT